MNADGSGQRQLTSSPAVGEFDQTPAWSPDGQEIVSRPLGQQRGFDPWAMQRADGGRGAG